MRNRGKLQVVPMCCTGAPLSLSFSLGCNTPVATQGLDGASGEHHFISQEQVCAHTLGHTNIGLT